jgi:hypothetical protein
MDDKLRAGVLAVCIAALGSGVALGAAAQQAPPQPTPKVEPKKEAPTYAGKWDFSIEMGEGPVAALLTIVIDEKDPKKVTGSLNSDRGNMAFTGEIAEGELWFAISPDGSTQVWLNGKLQEDGTIKGAVDVQGNKIPWVAKRSKDK